MLPLCCEVMNDNSDFDDLLAPEDPAASRSHVREDKRNNRRALWVILGGLLVVVVAIAAVVGTYAWNLNRTYTNSVTQVDPFEELEEIEDFVRPEETVTGAMNILLLGSDTRADMDDIQEGGPTGQRSDTLMVAHVSEDRESIQVMSIMRDNWVPIPGRGENKINAALAFGGIPLVIATVEQFIDQRIDHVAIIDFESFKGLTEALGGVTVNNSVPFSAGGHSYGQGTIELDTGEKALAFVRERKSFPDGDYQRVRNQQTYIKGVVNKVMSRETLTSPSRISDMVSTVSPYLTVDEDLTFGALVDLGVSLRNVRGGDITFFTSPTSGTGWAGQQSIVVVNEAEMVNVRQAFKDDTLVEWHEGYSGY